MGLAVIATAWYPLHAITALPSQSYNEGWNAYRQSMALAGQPLYPVRPALWTTNYPFLSFHLIAFLSGTKAGMVRTGRIICFAALIATALLAGSSIAAVTASRPAARYAGLSLFAGLACFYGAGRAVNDPEMLSLAFASLGLFAYFKSRHRAAWIILAAIAFALSLFTKHDLIALPLSVAITLAITRNHRALAIFCAAGLTASAVLLALTFHLDGRYFFSALVQPRAYESRNLIAETLHYLLHFAVPLLLAASLLIRDPATPHRAFLLTLLVCSNLLAIFFSGGDGVAANIFFAPALADLLACVIALRQLQRHPGRGFQAALILTTLAALAMLPAQLRTDLANTARRPAATQAARLAIAALAAHPGPAICEDLLLCFNAGKPIGYDPYYVNDEIRTARLQQSAILAALSAHAYAVIQINGAPAFALRAARHGGRFTKPFLQTLFRQYHPILLTPFYALFVPNTPAPSPPSCRRRPASPSS